MISGSNRIFAYGIFRLHVQPCFGSATRTEAFACFASAVSGDLQSPYKAKRSVMVLFMTTWFSSWMLALHTSASTRNGNQVEEGERNCTSKFVSLNGLVIPLHSFGRLLVGQSKACYEP